MKILTVTFPGYNPDMDERVKQAVGPSELLGAGYSFISGQRDMEFLVKEFGPATTGAALTALGVQWKTRAAE